VFLFFHLFPFAYFPLHTFSLLRRLSGLRVRKPGSPLTNSLGGCARARDEVKMEAISIFSSSSAFGASRVTWFCSHDQWWDLLQVWRGNTLSLSSPFFASCLLILTPREDAFAIFPPVHFRWTRLHSYFLLLEPNSFFSAHTLAVIAAISHWLHHSIWKLN